MIFDTHMHCDYSCDSEMTFADAITAAAAQGIGMTVTEHWDYDYPTNPQAFTFDIDEYFARFKPLCNDRVLIGIEIGMQTHTANEDTKVAQAHAFDYVLASIHCIGGRDLYEPTCYEGRTRQQIVEEFLHDSITCLEQKRDFDAFAHIDYICRYWPYEGAERELHLEDAPEQFDRLLQLLVEQNKPIEINTRRLDDAAAVAGLLPIYKRYHELGGRYCTIGSDAHYAEHVGRRLQPALELARQAGLTPVYFKARKMQIMEGL
jgi:histidinol-phosphatase (PHP family)